MECPIIIGAGFAAARGHFISIFGFNFFRKIRKANNFFKKDLAETQY
jgi:hypothetical protein